MMTTRTPDPARLPEVMDLGAIASAFGMTRSGARRAVLRGEFGPYFRVGRRAFVRRDSMLDTFTAREVHTTPIGVAPVPVAPEWAMDLLRRGRRRPSKGG
jgi:hypothetical protein